MRPALVGLVPPRVSRHCRNGLVFAYHSSSCNGLVEEATIRCPLILLRYDRSFKLSENIPGIDLLRPFTHTPGIYYQPENDLLRMSADRAGVAANYDDIAGTQHVRTDKTRRAILTAMNLRVGNREELILQGYESEVLRFHSSNQWMAVCRGVSTGVLPGSTIHPEKRLRSGSL